MQTLKRFFGLARPFWANPQQYQSWLLLIAMIGFALSIIQISVWITDWNKQFYDALSQFEGEKMPQLVMIYLGYIGLIVCCIICGNWLRKWLIFRWRTALTTQFQQAWLSEHRHYHLQSSTIDNPDQRIAEDIALLAEQSIDLFKYFVMNLAKLIAFVVILWQLSGQQQIQIGGIDFVLHGYLVWIALIYSLLCTLLMHWIGHKLQPLNIERQHREANYRTSLLHIREHSEQIALYHGESQENRQLEHQFQQIKQNWLQLINRELKVELFSASYLRLSLFIPIFATLPMYLARTMTFGDMMQARSAFGNVQDGFGWFMDYYKKLMEWSAVVARLHQFQQQLAQQPSPQVSRINAPTPRILIQNLSLYTAEQKPLFAKISFDLTACQWVLLAGKSGSGKSTLLRTLAGLHLHYQGHFQLEAHSTLFLPQLPYLSEGTLRSQLSYPSEKPYNDTELKQALSLVGLSLLADKLDQVQAWQNQLSGGEQQRLSLARCLLQQPAILFLDEATNQLDETSAVAIMQMLKQQLPHTLCLATSHQSQVVGLFDRIVRIDQAQQAVDFGEKIANRNLAI